MSSFRSYKRRIGLRNVHYASFANGINADYDENLLPVKYSKCTYNFDYSHGKLIDGVGVNEYKIHYSTLNPALTKTLILPAGVYPVKCCIYRQDAVVDLTAIVLYCSNSKLYYNLIHEATGTLHEFTEIHLTKEPLMFTYNLNGVNSLIVTNDTDGMWVKSGATIYQVTTAPKITSFCMHYERLFVTTSDDRHTIWFSDDMDPTNWNISSTEAGFITMYDDRGDILKCISFKDYVYIFRQYGISRLTAYANQNEFDVTNLYVSSGKIYTNSIALCGNKILYMAVDGLYEFNGATAHKIRFNIDSMFDGIDNSSCVAAYHQGHYYLACKMNFGGVVDNALICIDVSTGKFTISKGVNISSLSSIENYDQSALIAVVNVSGVARLGQVDNSGQLFGTATAKMWKSPATDFGLPNMPKTIKEICVDVLGDVQIEVVVDGVACVFNISTSTLASQRIKVNLHGYKIGINFASNSSGVVISNPQIIVGY